MVIGVKNQNHNTNTITRNGDSKTLTLPFDVDSEYQILYKKIMPCEEIERGNRERCENVKLKLISILT